MHTDRFEFLFSKQAKRERRIPLDIQRQHSQHQSGAESRSPFCPGISRSLVVLCASETPDKLSAFLSNGIGPHVVAWHLRMPNFSSQVPISRLLWDQQSRDTSLFDLKHDAGFPGLSSLPLHAGELSTSTSRLLRTICTSASFSIKWRRSAGKSSISLWNDVCTKCYHGSEQIQQKLANLRLIPWVFISHLWP